MGATNEGISVNMAAVDVLVLGPERAGSPSVRVALRRLRAPIYTADLWTRQAFAIFIPLPNPLPLAD